MWNRFTERARKAINAAKEEAVSAGAEAVDTEHLLLGLLDERDEAGVENVATRILEILRIELPRLRNEVEGRMPREQANAAGANALSPRSKRAINFGVEEARELKDEHIGTEHLLLGLLREDRGVAGQALAQLGMELEPARLVCKAIRSEAA